MITDKKLEEIELADPKFKIKRRLNITAFFLRRMFGGIQFSIVLPSLLPLLRQFSVPTWLFGVAVSIYSLATILTLPFVGRLYDKSNRIREILTILNILEIIGSLLYALPFSVWLPFLGRLIAGLGGGFAPLTNGEISWITSRKQRLGTFAIVELGEFVGIFFGPPLNLLFEKIDTHIGAWKIDYTNSPGIFCAFMWILMQLVTQLMVKNLARDYLRKQRQEKMVEVGQDTEVLFTMKSMNGTKEDASQDEPQEAHEGSNDGDGSNTDEPSDTMKLSTKTTKSGSDPSPGGSAGLDAKLSIKQTFREFKTPEILAILFTVLSVNILVLSSDALIPLFTQSDFGWSTVNTSFVYLGAALLLVVIFVSMKHFSDKLSEPWCLTVSLVSAFISGGLLSIYKLNKGNKNAGIGIFFGMLSTGVTALPACQIGGKSLMSKVTPIGAQGVMQSAVAIVVRFGAIVGPIFGSFAFNYLYIASGLICSLCFGCFIWFTASIPKLRERKRKQASAVANDDADLEAEEV